MKISKTEQKLLDKIARSRHKVGSIAYGYHTGSKTGLKGWGHRESQALSSLVKKGLVKVLLHRAYREPKHNLYTEHWTEVSFTLVGGTE